MRVSIPLPEIASQPRRSHLIHRNHVSSQGKSTDALHARLHTLEKLRRANCASPYLRKTETRNLRVFTITSSYSQKNPPPLCKIKALQKNEGDYQLKKSY